MAMTREQWLTMIVREANVLVNEHEAELRAALGGEDGLDAIGARIDARVHEVLVDVEDIWDVIRHSSLQDPDPKIWKNAESWSGMLTTAAFACLTHDLVLNVTGILQGKLPRLDPRQIMHLLEKGEENGGV